MNNPDSLLLGKLRPRVAELLDLVFFTTDRRVPHLHLPRRAFLRLVMTCTAAPRQRPRLAGRREERPGRDTLRRLRSPLVANLAATLALACGNARHEPDR